MKKYLILILVILCVSCSDEEVVETMPDDVLSQQEMVELLVDIQLIEGGIIIRKLDENKFGEEINAYYQNTFKKHGLSKKTFEYNMKYYSDHLEKLEIIYEEVINELSRLQAESETQQPIKK